MHDISLSASSQELYGAVYIIKIDEMGNVHITLWHILLMFIPSQLF
jgi:hypothetical protein